jgi:hypothetical protein
MALDRARCALRQGPEALASGGVLAAFWNRPPWREASLREELARAYARAAPDFEPDRGFDPMHPATDTPPALEGDWQREIAAAEGFERPRVRSYDWSQTYKTDDYLDLLQTHSGHIVRPPAQRRAILQEVGEVIDRNGGSIELPLVAVLCLAERRL